MADEESHAEKRWGDATMLKQSLEGEIKGIKAEFGQSTKFEASSAEKLAQAQEAVAVTTKAFEEDTA